MESFKNRDTWRFLQRRARSGARLAFALLKALGTLEKPTPGSTDPEEIEQRMQIEKRQKEAKLMDDDFLASIGGLRLGRKK